MQCFALATFSSWLIAWWWTECVVVNVCVTVSWWCTGDIKPTVVHRDVNSRNVLVKADLSLCLCDFGFAMKLATSRLTQSNDEHSSLADVRFLLCFIFDMFSNFSSRWVVSCYNLILVVVMMVMMLVVFAACVCVWPGWYTALHGSWGTGRLSQSVRLSNGFDTSWCLCTWTGVLGDWHSLSWSLSRWVTSSSSSCVSCTSECVKTVLCVYLHRIMSVVVPPSANIAVTLTFDPWPWKPDQFVSQLYSHKHT